MQISASFLGSKKIAKDLEKLNETDVDFIHVDVMDGKFVKGKSLSFSEIRKIYKYTSKRLDVHLMVEKPRNFIKDYALLNTEYITIHLEIDEDIKELLNFIKSYGIKCGLAIKPTTPVLKLIPYIKMADLVLLMSVEPGKSGQEFLTDTSLRLKELKSLIQNENPKVKIAVDGGINEKTVKKVLPIDLVISGSYILNGENYQEQINHLR